VQSIDHVSTIVDSSSFYLIERKTYNQKVLTFLFNKYETYAKRDMVPFVLMPPSHIMRALSTCSIFEEITRFLGPRWIPLGEIQNPYPTHPQLHRGPILTRPWVKISTRTCTQQLQNSSEPWAHGFDCHPYVQLRWVNVKVCHVWPVMGAYVSCVSGSSCRTYINLNRLDSRIWVTSCFKVVSM
jgi:hypothetical protein